MRYATSHNGVLALLLRAVALITTAMSAAFAAVVSTDTCLRAEHWTQHPQQIDTQWIDNPPLWGTYRPGIYFGTYIICCVSCELMVCCVRLVQA